MVGTGNDHVTRAVIPRDVNRRASLIDILYARVKMVKHSKLQIPWLSDHLNTSVCRRNSGFAPFALILPNNPQYQLGR